MSEMVERVVRDVRQAVDAMPFEARTFDEIVRLVIAAMREPTEAMMDRIQECRISFGGFGDDSPSIEQDAAKEAWQQAIDEALK